MAVQPEFFGDAEPAPPPGPQPTVDLRPEHQARPPAAAEPDPEPDFPTFGDDDWEDDDFTPEAAAPEPEEDEEPAEDPRELRRQINDLTQRINGLQAQDPTRNALAIADAFEQRDKMRRQVQAREEQLKAPRVDFEEAISDPDKFNSALERFAEWGYRRAVTELGPSVQEASLLANVMEPAYYLLAEQAETRAAKDLIANGVVADEKEFRELLPVAHQVIHQYVGDNAIGNMRARLNPQMLTQAIAVARSQAPAKPRKAPKTPASVGTGDRRGARHAHASAASAGIFSTVEKITGVKIPDKAKAAHAARFGRR